MRIEALKDISGRIMMKKGETRNVFRELAEVFVAEELAKVAEARVVSHTKKAEEKSSEGKEADTA
jgi:hypothetical protein